MGYIYRFMGLVRRCLLNSKIQIFFDFFVIVFELSVKILYIYLIFMRFYSDFLEANPYLGIAEHGYRLVDIVD